MPVVIDHFDDRPILEQMLPPVHALRGNGRVLGRAVRILQRDVTPGPPHGRARLASEHLGAGRNHLQVNLQRSRDLRRCELAEHRRERRHRHGLPVIEPCHHLVDRR
jgi:hypothetical protein